MTPAEHPASAQQDEERGHLLTAPILKTARLCPNCEERPCVESQRLCQPCRALYQRQTRNKHRQRRLELAARRLLTLMKPEHQNAARKMAEERGQPLSAVLIALAISALSDIACEERGVFR